MVINMITTMCFSICGYFAYPVFKNSILLSLIKKLCSVDISDFYMEIIKLPKDRINHFLLFSSGDYVSFNGRDLGLLISEEYTALSVRFKNKYGITSEILINPVDNNGYEVSYMLEEEELDSCKNKNFIIKECARVFFDTLTPLYGCCGTNMFVEGIEHIEEENIINSKFFHIGYVGLSVSNKFDFINYRRNNDKFLIEKLKNGNMYIRKSRQSETGN